MKNRNLKEKKRFDKKALLIKNIKTNKLINPVS